jgi:regulator of replication initiation timing
MCDLRQKVNLNLADAAGTLRDSNVQLLAEVGRLELENRALRKKLAR